jgi:hypothetical protein
MRSVRAAEGANLGVRFVAELGAYAALGYWGASTGSSTAGRASLAVIAPLTAMVVWSLLLAPKARWHLAEPAALVLELLIFAFAAVALASAGPITVAVVFGVVAAGNTTAVRIFGRHRHAVAVGIVGGATR